MVLTNALMFKMFDAEKVVADDSISPASRGGGGGLLELALGGGAWSRDARGRWVSSGMTEAGWVGCGAGRGTSPSLRKLQGFPVLIGAPNGLGRSP
ncbi:MAG: hypothetical protein HY319_28910 [Armatimonadetes bacterium]|nr:hypothetical protein [Armatimonadota bacterium]